MGILRAKSDYESLPNSRMGNDTMAKKPKLNPSTPVRRSGRLKGHSPNLDASSPQVPDICENESQCSTVVFENKTETPIARKPKLCLLTPVRRSDRLKGVSSDSDSSPVQAPSIKLEERVDTSPEICEYESIRNARILENKARMALLGLQRRAGELWDVASASKSKRIWRKRKLDLSTPPRRSERLKGIPGNSDASAGIEAYWEKEYRSEPAKRRISFSDRCGGKGRGSLYDPIYGITCHFCRQKKLCGEEDCRRCGEGDINQPCIGKTECTSCHSSNGVMCRACLKVRYGEELEEVREKNDWMCPHCIEEKGTKPYWICNSSICLKKRKMAPTGIAIFRAREEGYESVAHLLMDKLKCQ